MFGFISAPIAVAILFNTIIINDEIQAKIQFEKENPSLVLGDRTFLCFENSLRSLSVGFLMAAGLAGIFFVGLILIIILYYRIKTHKSLLNSTYKMQFMLLRALMAQLTISYLFLLLPMMTGSFAIFLKMENGGQICSILITITSFHEILDYGVMLYFIRFVLKC